METDFDFTRLAGLTNNQLFSSIILAEENNPATIERLKVLSNIEKKPGLHILQSARQTGSTLSMVKNILFQLECRSNKTYAIGTSNIMSSRSIVDRFRDFIITKLNPRDYDITVRHIHNKNTNSRVCICVGGTTSFRGLSCSGIYMDCFNLWDDKIQVDILKSALPSLYSLNSPCIIMNTGLTIEPNPWYEELIQQHGQYLFPITLNDASIRSQSNYINRIGIDAYRREYLCIR